MTMRITGMNSGLDTESIIQELVKAKKTKSDNLTKDKTKLEWKSEAWSTLNTKIKTFYSSSLSNLRFSTAYLKKTTSVSNSSAVSVITGEAAMNGVQTLSVNKLAKSGYMTGAKLQAASGKTVTGDTLVSELSGFSDVLSSEEGGVSSGSFSITTNGKSTTITVDSTTKVSDIVSKLKNAGVSANFDENNQRIFIASATSGVEADFALTANNVAGFKALTALGINEDLNTSTAEKPTNENAKTLKQYQTLAGLQAQISSIKTTYTKNVTDDDGNVTGTEFDIDAYLADEANQETDLFEAIKAELVTTEDGTENYGAALAALEEKVAYAQTVLADDFDGAYSGDAVRIAGQDAEITLNGVTYTGKTNNVEVNGITFTCLSEAENVTVTTQEDTDGIYDMIRNFIGEYNKLINEFDKLYNADSASDYKPLTDEEKEDMSDSEIEKWEKTIKDSLLRKDTTLGTLQSAFKSIMADGYKVNGEKMYLTQFGIETLSYFTAAENEKNALHIDGDDKDGETSGNADKLKTMIANDPDTVVSFFTQLSRAFYSKLSELSASSDNSSAGSFYDDKKMKTDISDYKTKISEAEDKLADYEDKYYKKFSNMEVALAKLESSTSSITSLLGSN